MCHGGISRGASETWATIDTAKLLTLLPIYDGLDVTVTSNIILWFRSNRSLVSCRIYRLFIYGEHSIANGQAEIRTVRMYNERYE